MYLKRLSCICFYAVLLLLFSCSNEATPPPTDTDKSNTVTVTDNCIVIYEPKLDKSVSRLRSALKELIGKTPSAYKSQDTYQGSPFEVHIGKTSATESFCAELEECEYGVKISTENGNTKVLIAAQDAEHIGLAANLFIDYYLPDEGKALKKTDTVTKIGEKKPNQDVKESGLDFEESLITVALTSGGTYARMATLADGRIICTYGAKKSGDKTPQIYATFSSDKGLTWSESVAVTAGIDGDILECANGIPYRLEDGTIIVGYRANEDKIVGQKTYHSSIRVMCSKDGGQTWERHSIVWDLFEKDIKFSNSYGLWEPHFGMLNGELACFFAIGKNVYDYDHIINSTDIFVFRDGAWVRAHYTSDEVPGAIKNGMPVWQEIKEGGYIMTVESTQNQKTAYKNVLTTKILTSRDGIHWVNQCDVYVPDKYKTRSAAPYIVQLPDGRFVVSYMSDEDLSEPSNNEQMILKISISKSGLSAYDLKGEGDFEGPYNVFGTPVGSRSTYGGMMVDDEYLYVYGYSSYPENQIVLRRAKLK